MNLSTTFESTPASALKKLVHVLHDGQLGFQQAAENVKSPRLKELFFQYSLQRSKLAGELQTELLALGEKNPEKEGTTFSGDLHRAWIGLKAALVSGDDYSVLSEAERGEDAAKQAYRDVLQVENLPAVLKNLVLAQEAQVQLAHDEIKALRDAAKPS